MRRNRGNFKGGCGIGVVVVAVTRGGGVPRGGEFSRRHGTWATSLPPGRVGESTHKVPTTSIAIIDFTFYTLQDALGLSEEQKQELLTGRNRLLRKYGETKQERIEIVQRMHVSLFCPLSLLHGLSAAGVTGVIFDQGVRQYRTVAIAVVVWCPEDCKSRAWMCVDHAGGH